MKVKEEARAMVSMNGTGGHSSSGGGGGFGGGGRDDCWTESETLTLMEAWGDRYLLLNRGNLRQKDWAEVAEAVNVRRENDKKGPRTDVQCRNRVDTVKKKYKIERMKPEGTSIWPLFEHMDYLIGAGAGAGASLKRIMPAPSPLPPLPYKPPVATPSPAPTPAHVTKNIKFFGNGNRNGRMCNVFIGGDGGGRSSSKSIGSSTSPSSSLGGGGEEELKDEDIDEVYAKKRRVGVKEVGNGMEVAELAKSILKFGEVYERMEEARLKQMMELEKQRMEFIKEMEIKRMEMVVEAQIDLKKMKYSMKGGSKSGELYR